MKNIKVKTSAATEECIFLKKNGKVPPEKASDVTVTYC